MSKRVVIVRLPISVGELARAMGAKVSALIATLTLRLQIPGKTVGSPLDRQEIERIGIEHDVDFRIVGGLDAGHP